MKSIDLVANVVIGLTRVLNIPNPSSVRLICAWHHSQIFRQFLLDDIVAGADALSRDAARSLALSVGLNGGLVPGAFRALAPKLTEQDRKVCCCKPRIL